MEGFQLKFNSKHVASVMENILVIYHSAKLIRYEASENDNTTTFTITPLEKTVIINEKDRVQVPIQFALGSDFTNAYLKLLATS